MTTGKEITKKPVDKKTTGVDSTIAGGSVGALVLMIAQTLPETSIIADILTYSAPFIGIGAKSTWAWGKYKIDNYLNNRQFDKYLENCKNFIQKSLNDPNISDERKAQLKADYDKLNALATNVHFHKIKSVKFDDDYKSIMDFIDKMEVEEAEIVEE